MVRSIKLTDMLVIMTINCSIDISGAAAPKLPAPAPTGDHDSSPEQIAVMSRDHDFTALQNYGGASLPP